MRKSYFYSLVFALLSSASIAVVAAPVSIGDTVQPSVNARVITEAQDGKVDLNNGKRSINPTGFAMVGALS